MSDNLQIPTVTFRVYRGAQLSMRFGKLVVTPDGRHWAFREDADLAQDPQSVGAFELDPAQLVLQPNNPDREPVYLYREVFHVP
jgi:hypothetical protein